MQQKQDLQLEYQSHSSVFLTHFLNVAHYVHPTGRMEVEALLVKCSNLERNCDWEGTVGTLENHLSTCMYSLVPCPKRCTDNVLHLRKDLQQHLKTECPQRQYKCPECGEKGTCTSITQEHEKVCSKKILSCPNPECMRTMQRQHLRKHLDVECASTVVTCKYKGIGCDVKVSRKNMLAHEDAESRLHLYMAMDRIGKLEATVKSLKQENEELRNEKLVTFALTDFNHKKKTNTEERSPSFYTEPQGYQLAIEVYANGYKEGRSTHLSVYAYILKGKNDRKLRWPFVGEITITLLNQLSNENHFSKTVVMKSEQNVLAKDNWGYPRFIPHHKLGHDPAKNTQYLMNDTLYFRVSAEARNSKPWLKCSQTLPE